MVIKKLANYGRINPRVKRSEIEGQENGRNNLGALNDLHMSLYQELIIYFLLHHTHMTVSHVVVLIIW